MRNSISHREFDTNCIETAEKNAFKPLFHIYKCPKMTEVYPSFSHFFGDSHKQCFETGSNNNSCITSCLGFVP
jgi:hypothetical protein